MHIKAPAIDADIREAFARMSGYAEFERIKKYLRDKITYEAECACMMKDEVDSRWAQGRAQGVSEVLDMFLTATKVIREEKTRGDSPPRSKDFY